MRRSTPTPMGIAKAGRSSTTTSAARTRAFRACASSAPRGWMHTMMSPGSAGAWSLATAAPPSKASTSRSLRPTAESSASWAFSVPCQCRSASVLRKPPILDGRSHGPNQAFLPPCRRQRNSASQWLQLVADNLLKRWTESGLPTMCTTGATIAHGQFRSSQDTIGPTSII